MCDSHRSTLLPVLGGLVRLQLVRLQRDVASECRGGRAAARWGLKKRAAAGWGLKRRADAEAEEAHGRWARGMVGMQAWARYRRCGSLEAI